MQQDQVYIIRWIFRNNIYLIHCYFKIGVLTATAKVALLKHGGNISNFPMRLEKMDFADFGGKFKSKTNKKVAKDQY